MCLTYSRLIRVAHVISSDYTRSCKTVKLPLEIVSPSVTRDLQAPLLNYFPRDATTRHRHSFARYLHDELMQATSFSCANEYTPNEALSKKNKNVEIKREFPLILKHDVMYAFMCTLCSFIIGRLAGDLFTVEIPA